VSEGVGAGLVVVHDEPVMGTVASFTVHPGALSPDEVEAAVAAACAELHRLDGIFSTWLDESPMSRLRRGELALSEAPSEIAEVLDLCNAAKTATAGWFDPWSMPGGVDPTGLVKGWAVESAAKVLRRAGAASGMVNAGGDIAAFGEPSAGQPWRIGIRHPWRVDALACVLEIAAAVATSGTYERGEHLLNPFTGKHASRVASASVTGPDLAIADAFATALAVAGEIGLDFVRDAVGYDAYLILLDGTEVSTGGISFAAP
jgi:thiamine biosynthesis lipoprotein